MASILAPYAGASDNTVRRMSAANGGTGWVVNLAQTPYAAPLLADGRLFVPKLAGRVFALQDSTGDPT